MSLESYQRHGEHVFLNGKSAKEIVQKALDHLENEYRTDARKLAFDDCTAYWKNELQKINDSSKTDADKWILTLIVFGLGKA